MSWWAVGPAGSTSAFGTQQAPDRATAERDAKGYGDVVLAGPFKTADEAIKWTASGPTPQPGGGPVTGTPGGPPLKNAAEVRTAALTFALAQQGKPYVWGGDGPPQSAGFDCSGLTYEAFLHAGVTIPRVAAGQQSAGQVVTVDQLQPADLVFAGTPAFHVGMYAGNGEIVVSDRPGTVVHVRQFVPSEWTGGFRTMVAGGIVLTSFPGSGLIGGLSGGLHAIEGLAAIVQWFTPKHLERAGKIALGILIIAVALIILNRKKIQVAAEKTVKAGEKVAEVAAV